MPNIAIFVFYVIFPLPLAALHATKILMNPEELIAHFALAPHPEGGFYRRTYCSSGTIPQAALSSGFAGPRPFGTAILFLLREGDYSRLHRIRQDEIWHFYLGGPLRLALLGPDGAAREVMLGQKPLDGQHLQYAVPAGFWFGATPCPGSGFSLVGCTVSPGFDFADLKLGRRKELLATFPAAAAGSREFCPPKDSEAD